ncbi:MAG: hypothetical protein R3232_04020 [Clostridia bacterium]|nr:hypothetical protein [Clostridia bacterium]
MINLLIISRTENDLTRLLGSIDGIISKIQPPDSAIPQNKFNALVILDWPEDENNGYEDLVLSGIPSLIRTRPGLGAPADASPVSTRFKRLVSTGRPETIDWANMILDDQDNMHLPSLPKKNPVPVLVYKDNIMSHSVFKGSLDNCCKSDYALWIEDSVIYCSFDITNFALARFSPIPLWQDVMSFICRFLSGIDNMVFSPSYTNGFLSGVRNTKSAAFKYSMEWFESADILIDDGKRGVYEGYATEIKPDGRQKKAQEIRNDCCGEVMFSYFMDYLLNGNEESKVISDNLSDFIFNEMFTDDPGGILDGMMKWSLSASHICYQDDVARSIIPQMLKCRYAGETKYMDECIRALEFLYKTTGSDGLRVTRTENQRLDEDEVKRLASEPAAYPSAHYTAYYHAALLLNSVITDRQDFKEMGTMGLEAIMDSYPDTKRCQSETQELARLILPLSLLYEATGEAKHRKMLYRVTRDLMKFRHETGTYLEWDTGYQSRYSRTTGDECSILTENGDPVSDLLYTVNWLPLGFALAHFVTKDPLFLELWSEITDFMSKAQIQSPNPVINGAWARGWDTELKEVFALPNDVGWGPWCIESGWTVAEIASGIAMGLLKDKLNEFY